METEGRNNLKDYLPSDISNTSYEAKITNVSNEIVTEAQKTDASYSYNVSKNGNIGNQAEIEFTIHSNNYEDITFKVHITLTDRITVTPKEGTEPAIDNNGKKEIIRDYTKDADYTWKPSNAGTYIIYVTAKDTAENTAGDSWEGIKVNQTATINGITYKVTKVVNTKNAQVMIKSFNKKKSSIVIPDYVTVKCKVVSINKKALIKVPKKQYNKYKKLFTSKTGFKEPMKLKK